MIVKRLRLLIEKSINRDRSPKKLAFTICLGVYIGLSPFIGLRTLLTFLCGWIFALDLAILFAISLFIHNPWTIVPIYILNHSIGRWLFSVFNIDSVSLDPSWVESCSFLLKEYIGLTGVSLSAFLVGGNLLGISMSVMLYPLIKRILSVYVSKKNSTCVP